MNKPFEERRNPKSLNSLEIKTYLIILFKHEK